MKLRIVMAKLPSVNVTIIILQDINTVKRYFQLWTTKKGTAFVLDLDYYVLIIKFRINQELDVPKIVEKFIITKCAQDENILK